jgi:hypothetical protein
MIKRLTSIPLQYRRLALLGRMKIFASAGKVFACRANLPPVGNRLKIGFPAAEPGIS